MASKNAYQHTVYKTPNFKVNRLQQQKPVSDYTPVSQEQISDAIMNRNFLEPLNV